ncbi:hypothetical protein [Marvinbryantia formatexigens]|nr:hypothetical protein [Marvinbryantia formatexigens]UWO23486.1 hypothetical protein NQ534_13620 [Marvinbryantia formatexigens DSM 14469]SDG56772.1 hypothetical protein SAMN05660368_02825 [Marvinbryantia formatexigens]
MTDNNQQYKWRQRKQRNTRLGVWIVAVILVSVGGTFVYEGLRDSDPQRVAEEYVKAATGVESFTVEAGDRSLNADNQFVQDYTFTYTVDGKETSQRLSLTQQQEKKYGLFDQWTLQAAGANAVDMDLIVPAGVQVLIDGVSPDESSIEEDDTLSPGAIRYKLTSVEPTAKLQINGLPFESYEGTLETSNGLLDVRDRLEVSENAKVQMEEIGKSMINELYTAVMQGKTSADLGESFAQVPNKDNLFKAISSNLFRGDELQADDITFEGFEPVFGDIYYPGRDEESYIGIEMKLSYTCSYEQGEAETESETETETETEAESESETDTETENTAGSGEQKEATFYFRYQDGNCIVTSAEIPGVI